MPSEVAPPRTILVVDDELGVRRALSRLLEDAGYTVISTDDGHHALELLQMHPIDLILTDHHMPELSGIDLLKLVRVRHPQVVRIILTADKEPEVPVRSINESEVYRFIRKPWNNTDMRTIMYFAFEAIRLEREKRRLLSADRDGGTPAVAGVSPDDPAGLERELLLLAEDEARGN
jgi:DNA-binding NtrC family response regulator